MLRWLIARSAGYLRVRGRTARARRRRLGSDGSVAAEFAVALPFAVLLLIVGTQTLAAAGQLVALQDAAADAARLLGRGESTALAAAAVAQAVPDAVFASRTAGELVCATASARVPIAGIVTIPLQATSCALSGGK